MLNSILEGEMEGHLDDEERDAGNRKNGKSKKLLKTSSGTIEVTTPRDRLGGFEPEMARRGKPSWPRAWRIRLLKKGMRIEYVSKLLGHASVKQTEVYAKIMNEELDKAMEIFNN